MLKLAAESLLILERKKFSLVHLDVSSVFCLVHLDVSLVFCFVHLDVSLVSSLYP